jgi:hypothetical protein
MEVERRGVVRLDGIEVFLWRRPSAYPEGPKLEGAENYSVQLQSNSRGWLHRMFPRKRHQTRHLVNFAGLLAKQVLSQLSYTPQTTI